MQLSRVHHISLNVADAARDTKFYIEILGFQAIPRPDMGFKGAWLAMGDQQLHLLEVPGFEAPKGQHFAFGVTNIEAARAHLMAQGVDVSEPSQLHKIFEFIAGAILWCDPMVSLYSHRIRVCIHAADGVDFGCRTHFGLRHLFAMYVDHFLGW